jgi:putative membrane protein
MGIGSRIAQGIAALSLLAPGCTSEDRTEAQSPEETYSQPEMSTAETPQAAPTIAQPTPEPSTPPAQVGMTDEQILAVLDAANMKEVEESRAVLARTKNADVKAFANMMIQHHTEANNKASKLAQKLSMTPADFEKSTALRSDTSQQVDQLKSATMGDLDRQYVDLMVADHRAVLDMIDSKILADVKNAELKQLVTEVRPTVAKHLEDGQALQTKLQGAGAKTTPRSKSPNTTPPNTGKEPPGNTMQPSPPGAAAPGNPSDALKPKAAKKNP